MLASVLAISNKCIFGLNVWITYLSRSLNVSSHPHTWHVSVSDGSNEYHNAHNSKSRLAYEKTIHPLSITSFWHMLLLFWGHYNITPQLHIPCDVRNPLLGYTKLTQNILKQKKKCVEPIL